jgi:hypothetical protein
METPDGSDLELCLIRRHGTTIAQQAAATDQESLEYTFAAGGTRLSHGSKTPPAT